MFGVIKIGCKPVFGLLVAFSLATPVLAAQDSAEEKQRANWLTSLTQELMVDKDFEIAHTTARISPLPKARPIEMTKAWVDAQPAAHGGDELNCLSEALYFEARGETVKGQFAVAEVILNRVESDRFPSSACGVINQGTGKKYQCQFTYTCDGRKEVIHEEQAYERVAKIAKIALDGRAPSLTKGATHYHTRSVNPAWARVYTKTATIGYHIFYRHTWQTASN